MSLHAGAARRDISPTKPLQLCGYPHVPRVATGAHDPILASVLFLQNESGGVLLGALDVLMINADVARRFRRRIAAALGIAESGVLISCTHTHSAPVTLRYFPFDSDPAMPPPDPAYLEFVENQLVAAAKEAKQRARPAELAWTTADARGVGGNRRSPDGPTDPEVGVLGVRADGRWLAVALVYSMHPTVIHEDTPLVSSDFPHYARQQVREACGDDVIVVYHTGPCGNQSPRYHVTAQTFAEAERLGRKLGAAVAASLKGLRTVAAGPLAGALCTVELPRRKLPSVAEAERLLAASQARYQRLQAEGADRAVVRTAEVDIFGTEGTLVLARAQQRGELDRFLAGCQPFEVQAVRIAGACLVGWPGEVFTDYSLRLKQRAAHKTFVTAFTNGELQGYIVTPEAVAEGGYEAAGRNFEPLSGEILVNAAVGLVEGLAQ